MNAVGKTHVITEQGEALDVRLQATNKVMLTNGERVDVKVAQADLATNGTRELIPAVATKRIMLLELFLSNGAAAATTAVVKSDSTAIGPIISMAANQFVAFPFASSPRFRSAAVNEALNITLSNGANVGAIAQYIEVPVDVDLA